MKGKIPSADAYLAFPPRTQQMPELDLEAIADVS